MLVDTQTLQMVRFRFDLPAMLARIGASGADAGRIDTGYLVHWQLVSLFGDLAPGVFSIRGATGRWLDVLGYAACDADRLRDRAASAPEDAKAASDLAALASKEMPNAWRVGARYSFELRVCPVIRRSADSPHGRRGSEVDAFLAACERSPDARVDRIQVYRDWVTRQMARDGASRLLSFDVAAFRRVRLHRRTQGGNRRARGLERPELEASGILEVADAGAFAALVARGVGRHRAFGYGMVLLAPER